MSPTEHLRTVSHFLHWQKRQHKVLSYLYIYWTFRISSWTWRNSLWSLRNFLWNWKWCACNYSVESEVFISYRNGRGFSPTLLRRQNKSGPNHLFRLKKQVFKRLSDLDFFLHLFSVFKSLGSFGNFGKIENHVQKISKILLYLIINDLYFFE